MTTVERLELKLANLKAERAPAWRLRGVELSLEAARKAEPAPDAARFDAMPDEQIERYFDRGGA